MRKFLDFVKNNFTLKEILAILGLGVSAGIIAKENMQYGYHRGYNDGVQNCIDVTKEIIEEIKSEEDTAK